MSFKRWFKWWLRSFSAMILFGSSKRKSDRQRKIERQKRREYERRKHHPLYMVKKRQKARSSNAILLDKMAKFFVASLTFLLAPWGLFKRAKRSKRIKTAVAQAAAKRASSTSAKSSVISSQKEAKNEAKAEKKIEKKIEKKTENLSAKSPSTQSAITDKAEEKGEKAKEILQENVRVEALKKDEKSKENSPKSTPKNPGDTWIRKRMIAEIKRKEMAEKIDVGDTFDLALVENNSVALIRKDSHVATVCKSDTIPLTTALKLGRKLYAIVTEIKENEIEFEGWQI
ncbi:MAG: hypothetical protein IJ360_01095 [Clostridia bacterium]|nr:hypothetical protein [Clostridia bacterium]